MLLIPKDELRPTRIGKGTWGRNASAKVMGETGPVSCPWCLLAPGHHADPGRLFHDDLFYGFMTTLRHPLQLAGRAQSQNRANFLLVLGSTSSSIWSWLQAYNCRSA